jgi:hypothetical protein
MKKKRAKMVREPIQVYLASDERAMLDELAERARLSRAEVLRRALRSYAVEHAKGRSPLLEVLLALSGDDWPADMAERHDDYLAREYLKDL